MIPEIFIEDWRKSVKWQTPAQVEQDLVISRALVDLYNEPHIKNTLIFRGGTALNKLFINPPARYSEDIDFVQKNPGPIGQTINAIRDLLEPWLGVPKWKITQRGAKLIYKYESINEMPAKLKIEINTTEHFQVLPIETKTFVLDSEWFNGSSEIITYDIDELIATKLRALYQRRKGRDLFDLWYVVSHGLINLNQVFDIFSRYCNHGSIQISKEEFMLNLEQKKNHRDFLMDMNVLLPSKLNWDFEQAYQLVTERIISRLP